MDQTLLLGSNNQNKLQELQFCFSKYGVNNIKFITPKDLGLDSPPETEDTFEGNAILKAKYYGDLSNLPVIADDTGLCVDALDGRPGVHTADWKGPDGDFRVAFMRVKRELEEKGIHNDIVPSKAVCVLALYSPKTEAIQTFRGEVKGVLNLSYMNNFSNDIAFGFQPIFIPQNYDVPISQISFEEWLSISHRSIAFKKLMEQFDASYTIAKTL